MSKESTASGGIGLCGMLFITFLVLKLCDVIDWSWWWVTAPLWGGFALILGVIVVGFLILGVLFLLGFKPEPEKPNHPSVSRGDK